MGNEMQDPSGGLIGGIVMAWAIFALIIVAISIWYTVYTTVWVYRDTKEIGADTTLWTLLVLFLGLIPLIIYLISVRKDAKDAASRCSVCRAPIWNGASFCTRCGGAIAQQGALPPSAATFVRNVIIFNAAIVLTSIIFPVVWMMWLINTL